jgi:hypothetical protein
MYFGPGGICNQIRVNPPDPLDGVFDDRENFVQRPLVLESASRSDLFIIFFPIEPVVTTPHKASASPND